MELFDDTVSPAQWRKFFACVANGYSISAALRNSRIARATAYRHKKIDASIASRWAEALEAGNDFYEDAARKRAVEGVKRERGIYSRDGELIATETETKYSDGLLLAILGARMPERYGRGVQEQAKQLAIAELNQIIDHLSNRLPPDVFTLVLQALADDTPNASTEHSPRALTSATTSNQL